MWHSWRAWWWFWRLRNGAPVLAAPLLVLHGESFAAMCMLVPDIKKRLRRMKEGRKAENVVTSNVAHGVVPKR